MAGPYYVSSVDGDDADDGSTWALAKATLDGALAVMAAGETCYLDSAHSHNYGASKAYTLVSGSNVNPIILMSVDRTGNPEPPIDGDYLAGASELTTGASSYDITFPAGFGMVAFGLTFEAADNINIGDDIFIRCQDGTLKYFKIAAGGADDTLQIYNDCVFVPQSASEGIVLGNGSRLEVIGGSLSSSVVSANFFIENLSVTGGAQPRIIGFDASAGTASGFSLIEQIAANQTFAGGTEILIAGCKLPANATLLADSFAEHTTRLAAFDFGTDTSVVPGIHVEDYRGLATEDTTTYRTGTYDGTANYSVKIDATAQTKRGVLPFKFKLWERGLTAANPTLTVQFVTDGAVTFDAADLWCEFVYPTASSAGKTVVSTVDADYGLGTAATLTAGAGAGAWTGEPASSNFYQIAHTVSGGRIGPHEVWVCLAPGAAENVFVCPRVDVT